MVLVFFWLCCMACGILVPRQGLKLVLAVKMLSPYPWTTSEFPYLPYFECLLLSPLNYSCRHLLGWLPTWSFYLLAAILYHVTLLLWPVDWTTEDHMTQVGPIHSFSGNLEFDLEHTVAFSLFLWMTGLVTQEIKRES